MKRYLEIQLTYQPPAVVLGLSGEIGPLSHVDLLDAGRSAIASELPVVVLDFRGVEYMNSAGISGLIQLFARLGSRGQRVYACGLSAHDRMVFTLMRLDDAVTLMDDLPAALTDYAQQTAGAALPPENYSNPEVGNGQPPF